MADDTPTTPLRRRRHPLTTDSAHASPTKQAQKVAGLAERAPRRGLPAAGAFAIGALAGAVFAGAALRACPALFSTRTGGEVASASPNTTYLLIDTFESGLNNQRISVLKAAALAAKHGYTLVLPAFKDVHGPQHGGAPGLTTILPFSHFYHVPAWEAHAAAHGFGVVPHLPPHLTQACTKQLSFAASFSYALTREFYAGWAQTHGVLCLAARAVWFAMEGNDEPDIGWGDNAVHAKGLVPSDRYRAEVGGALARAAALFGTASFIAVHVRTEPDWRRVCGLGTDRRRTDHWLGTSDRACWVHPRDVAAHLAASGRVKRGSLAFVMSADPVSSMPDLCGEGGYLTCFTPDEVWTDRDAGLAALVPRTQLVRAYISYLLAERAAGVYGNAHSTFSQQLVEGFREAGKPAEFYNPKCPLDEPCL